LFGLMNPEVEVAGLGEIGDALAKGLENAREMAKRYLKVLDVLDEGGLELDYGSA